MTRVLRNVSFLVLVVVCLFTARGVVRADECGWVDWNYYDGYDFTNGSSQSQCEDYCRSHPNPGDGWCSSPDVSYHEGINPNCGWCQCYGCVPI